MKLLPPFQNYVFARGGEAGQQVCTRAPFNGMMEYANLRIGTDSHAALSQCGRSKHQYYRRSSFLAPI